MAKRPSQAPPIIWGSILVASCVALVTLWNIIIVADYFRFKQLAGQPSFGAGRWWILAIGCVLFVGVMAGLIVFIVLLVRQIRTNQAQRNFIDAVTHELKTPLTSLKLHLQTLQMGRVPLAKQGEFHKTMLDDVARLDLLVDHVLAAARTEGRRRDMPFEPVSVMESLKEAIAVVAHRYGFDPAEVSIQGPACVVNSEAHALSLVFVNLIDNAAKYAGPVPQIWIEVIADGKTVEVHVHDNGIGIPRRQLKRVFQRFYRVGNELTRIRNGTGLGLYIVKETVSRLRGKVEARSNGEGRGSTFIVRLPGG
ncbi:Alkaline phosphatase synthesis sensor protein PhoR [compost metagenome]